MFTPEAIIDTVQNSKKQVVNTFVLDEKIKKGLVELIDAQTEFSKTLVKNTLSLSELYVKNLRENKTSK